VRLALPLTSKGETVDRVLGSITWNSAATLDKLVWELPGGFKFRNEHPPHVVTKRYSPPCP